MFAEPRVDLSFVFPERGIDLSLMTTEPLVGLCPVSCFHRGHLTIVSCSHSLWSICIHNVYVQLAFA